MARSTQAKAAGIGIGIVLTLSALFAVALMIVYSGAYNVAATEDHTAVTRWALDTTLKNSVARRVPDTPAPPSFTDAMIAAGAAEYKAMCQHCHGGPGVEREEWAGGMLPQPPKLVQHADQWQPIEVFWLVKHGVKMTGMPAFGPTHSDESLWNIAGFVTELPGMTAQRYAAFESAQHASHCSSPRNAPRIRTEVVFEYGAKNLVGLNK